MNPTTWRERICLSRAHISKADWPLVCIDLSITAPLAGPLILTMGDVERASVKRELGLTRYMAALGEAAALGWLAPLECLADGTIRTALRVPEGVA